MGGYGVKRGDRENNWSMFGYIPGDSSTSDGLKKSRSGVNLRILLAGNTFRIVSEERGRGSEGICHRHSTI